MSSGVSKPQIYALIAVLVFALAGTGFILGALVGVDVTMTHIENACLYTNRLELTEGRVIDCRHLDGVAIK